MQDKKTGTIADIINPRNPKVLDPPPIANCTMFSFHNSALILDTNKNKISKNACK